MSYKDPDKQREANRERQRRYRAERGLKAYPKGVTKGVTESGCDTKGVTSESFGGQYKAMCKELKKQIHQELRMDES